MINEALTTVDSIKPKTEEVPSSKPSKDVIEKDKFIIKGTAPKDKSHFVGGGKAEDTVKGNIGDEKPVSNVRLFSDEELVELGIRRFDLTDIEYDLPPTEEHQKLIDAGLQDEGGKKLVAKAKANSKARAEAAVKTTQLGSDLEFNTDNQVQGFKRKTFSESVEYIFDKPFVSADQAKFLIPEEAKVDKNKFVMSDGRFESVFIWEGDNKNGFPILRETNDLKIMDAFKNVIIETSHDEKYKKSNETDFMKNMVKNMRKK